MTKLTPEQADYINVKVDGPFKKNDYKIKVYEKTAYVICTEIWAYTTDSSELDISSRQVRFMEKVEGEWKIAFLSFIGTSGYEDEEGLEEMGLEFNSIR